MPESLVVENYGCTSSDMGRVWVEKIATTLPRSIRLTQIRRPEITWQTSVHCHPDFVQVLKDAWHRLDLDDPAQWSPDAARALQAYQSLGLERLFLRSLSAGDLCAVTKSAEKPRRSGRGWIGVGRAGLNAQVPNKTHAVPEPSMGEGTAEVEAPAFMPGRTSTEDEIEHGLNGCRLGLATLIGDVLFALLGKEAVAQ